VWTKTLFERRE